MKFPKFRRAIEKGLFDEDFVKPEPPPTRKEIEKRSAELRIPFCADHVDLLLEWGGSDFDQIRINALDEIERLDPGGKDPADGEYVLFANDFAGFMFFYDETGRVFSFNPDGGAFAQRGASVEDFLENFLLGAAGDSFYDDEWMASLREHGFVR